MPSRLYFPESTAAPVTPAANGTWTYTSEAVNRKLERSKTGTPLTEGTVIGPFGATDSALDRRYVSDALAPQLISGELMLQILAQEVGTTLDVAMKLEAYVVSNDGATVRGTLLPIDNWPSTSTYRPNSYGYRNKHKKKKLNGVFCQSGDRIVVAIGHFAFSGLGQQGQLKWGDPSATQDLPANDELESTDKVPWVEFSKELTFLPVKVDPGTKETVTAKSVITPLDPLPAPVSTPYEGTDEQLLLVRVTGSPARGFTFTTQRVLEGKYQRMEWWYHRNGGCGSFRLLLRENFPEQDIAIDEGWEIHVKIKLPDDVAYTLWYRGVIRSVSQAENGNEILTDVRGYGYVEQLGLIQVQKTYVAGSTVSAIVNDIVDTIIKPHSRIVRPNDLDATDVSGVDTSSYALAGDLRFETSALKALKFLSELQGGREFGVDERRAIYFRNNSSVSVVKSIFLEKDVISVIGGGKAFDRINRYKVSEWDRLHVRADPTDVTNYGVFEKPSDMPWITNDTDADRWADNMIALHTARESWRTFTWQGVDKRLDRGHPMGKITFYGRDTSNERNDYSVGKIQYVKGGFLDRGQLREIGTPPQQPDIHQPVLTATIFAGVWRKDLIEELERNFYEPLLALQSKVRKLKWENPKQWVTREGWSWIDTQGRPWDYYDHSS